MLTVRGLLTMMPGLSPTGFNTWYGALEEQHQVGTVGEFLPLVTGPISDVPTVWQQQLLAAARDSGQVVTNPPPVGGLPTLVLDAAVYRPGGAPTTVSERRSALVGWAVATFDLPRLFDLEQSDRRVGGAVSPQSRAGQRAALPRRPARSSATPWSARGRSGSTGRGRWRSGPRR